MSTETKEPKCQHCNLTSEQIAHCYPHRVSTVRHDPESGKVLCNACWADMKPFGQAKPERS